MKKSLLFCGVAALAFASCTQNEVLNVNENRAIGFDAFVGKPTKALDATSLSEFYVFGAYDYSPEGTPNVFNNIKVSEETGNWATEKTEYWINGKDYKFVAYSDDNSKIDGATFTNGTLTIPYTVGTKDLVASNIVSQNGNTTTAVGITLNHILAKVKFTFTNKLAAGYTIDIAGLQIADVPNKGTYTDNGTAGWASVDPTNNKTTLNSFAVSQIISGGSQSSNEVYVLPQNSSGGTGLTVTFNATIKDANGTVVNTPSFTSTIKPNWEMKYIYNYTLELTLDNTNLDDNVITFSPTVGGWENATEDIKDDTITNP